MKPDDVCPRAERNAYPPNPPLAPPIFPSAVYQCDDPTQADGLLAGTIDGYVYLRDGHPNADWLAARCRELHGAERAIVCASGMSALSLALLAHVEFGDHLVVSSRLYGRSLRLLTEETARLGIASTVVDTCDLQATAAACNDATRWLIVETITNPTLRVSDLSALAELAHQYHARLLVDNTFASPIVCRPLEWGADLVLESLTKIMNGHSDVMLGALCGRAADWERVVDVCAMWGLNSAPFECWLAGRGLATLAVRQARAESNALQIAQWLADQAAVSEVLYPGLASHPDHKLAARQFAGRYGTMVSFTLAGGLDAATRFIRASDQIVFSPSLGDLSTTLSHPCSTSHRALSPAQCDALGISPGTIRLSLGLESIDHIRHALEAALNEAR